MNGFYFEKLMITWFLFSNETFLFSERIKCFINRSLKIHMNNQNKMAQRRKTVISMISVLMKEILFLKNSRKKLP